MKIGIFLEKKVIYRLKFSKNVNNKKCVPKLIFFNEKKIEKDSDNFWHRKLTLKVRNWPFLITWFRAGVDLPEIFSYEKVLFFTQLSYRLMCKLLKKSYMLSSAYFVFLYILVTVPDWIVAGYSLSQPIFSVHWMLALLLCIYEPPYLLHTVYYSTLSIDFYHGCSFLCPSLPFLGRTFESWVSGLESWLEQYDRKMQPHHFLRGNFQKIGWVLWCIKVQICKQFYCEFMHSCLSFTNLNFDTS